MDNQWPLQNTKGLKFTAVAFCDFHLLENR